MSCGPPGVGKCVRTPPVVRRPMDALSVNQSAPSGPDTMPCGLPTRPIAKSVATPPVVIRPMRSTCVNHSAPSGPAVIWFGRWLAGSGNSRIALGGKRHRQRQGRRRPRGRVSGTGAHGQPAILSRMALSISSPCATRPWSPPGTRWNREPAARRPEISQRVHAFGDLRVRHRSRRRCPSRRRPARAEAHRRRGRAPSPRRSGGGSGAAVPRRGGRARTPPRPEASPSTLVKTQRRRDEDEGRKKKRKKEKEILRVKERRGRPASFR